MKTMSEEKAEYIAAAVIDQADDEVFEYKDPIKQVGFAQIEHVIAFDESLSDGAYRTYAIIISFAQQHDWATPSVSTIAGLRGKDAATISRHLAELQEHRLIDRQRRVGTSSKTTILDMPAEYINSAELILQKRNIAKMRGSSLQKRNNQPRKNAMKRITIKEEQENENSGAKCAPVPTPLAVCAFREIRRSYPPKETWGLIDKAVGSLQENLSFWKEVLIGWAAMGWNPRNVNGALEFYGKHEIPHNGNGHGKIGRTPAYERWGLLDGKSENSDGDIGENVINIPAEHQ